MEKTVGNIIYNLALFIVVFVLCVISYFVGTRRGVVSQSEETVVLIDTIFIDKPSSLVEVKSLEPNIVYLDRYMRDTVFSVQVVRDSVLVYLPIEEYTFAQDSLYKIKVRGHDVSLSSVEMYNRNTTTTLRSPIKHWSVNANLNSFTSQGMTDLSLGLGLEYTLHKWRFAGGYRIFATGDSGVSFSVERKIFEF